MSTYNETAMLVDCPVCGQPAGKFCHTLGGYCHETRYQAAQAQTSADRLNEIERSM